MFQPLAQATLQFFLFPFATGKGAHPHLTVAHFDGIGGNVVRPRVQRSPAFHIKAGVMPVAGENAVAQTAHVQRKAHVRTPVVQGDDFPLVVDHQDSLHHLVTLLLHLIQAACADPSVHPKSPPLPDETQGVRIFRPPFSHIITPPKNRNQYFLYKKVFYISNCSPFEQHGPADGAPKASVGKIPFTPAKPAAPTNPLAGSSTQGPL